MKGLPGDAGHPERIANHHRGLLFMSLHKSLQFAALLDQKKKWVVSPNGGGGDEGEEGRRAALRSAILIIPI
jgi:hypothetical protein